MKSLQALKEVTNFEALLLQNGVVSAEERKGDEKHRSIGARAV